MTTTTSRSPTPLGRSSTATSCSPDRSPTRATTPPSTDWHLSAPDHHALAGELRRLLAAYAEARDLIEIGAYVPGADPLVDRAVALRPGTDAFLRQTVDEVCPADEAFTRLRQLLEETP